MLVAQFAVNNWQEHDFFLLQSFSYLFPFCFVAMICRFPFRKELFSDFSAHNWMLHLRRKIQVKEERRKKNWRTDYSYMFFIAIYVSRSGIFEHINMVCNRCGTRIYAWDKICV